jgi:hypothetical protein
MRDLEQKIAQWDYDMEHHAEGNTTEYSIAVDAIEECKQLLARLRAAERVARASSALCELWTHPLADMDPRLVHAREAVREADVVWRRAVEYKAT